MSDSIADALIRIKNGYLVRKPEVIVRYSKLVLQLLKILQKEGYIVSCEQDNREIKVVLKYDDSRKPVLTDVKRVSKPSLRVYKGAKSLPVVLNGLGIALISTPQGVMTDREARSKKMGGEVLALVW